MTRSEQAILAFLLTKVSETPQYTEVERIENVAVDVGEIARDRAIEDGADRAAALDEQVQAEHATRVLMDLKTRRCAGCGKRIGAQVVPRAVAGDPVHPNPRCRAAAEVCE
jgi:hypothetical protein